MKMTKKNDSEIKSINRITYYDPTILRKFYSYLQRSDEAFVLPSIFQPAE